MIPDSPFDETIRVSNCVGGVHGRREGVQSGLFRRDIGQGGERPGRRAEQVSFLGFSSKGDGMQRGRRRVGRMDDRGDRILPHEISPRGIAAGLDGGDHGLPRGAGQASREILGQLDGVPDRRPAPLVLGIVIGRDGKLFDSARNARRTRRLPGAATS